jgi:hypothetical protein
MGLALDALFDLRAAPLCFVTFFCTTYGCQSSSDFGSSGASAMVDAKNEQAAAASDKNRAARGGGTRKKGEGTDRSLPRSSSTTPEPQFEIRPGLNHAKCRRAETEQTQSRESNESEFYSNFPQPSQRN